ncbi:hypothetical protein FOH24_13055 [Acetobacter tropicalis]|uniref:HTH cro/C1-type domain-containing protein n=1 Tax=Acetobacter tropicalis TaxID=104102 RepID=A0A095B5T3_9PROT|nr:hypothetical protein [Acetobacter tropicalis]KAA8387905.1 hypothetical protein FOH24_13055 [Acetobacter tropicalis]KAA8388818.1 hypothetical protein FOH22_08365 [Acetobacter tropicalis]KGB24303.1 hypothetical protein AtDm6_1301 [Acetobacter tropicalis]MDO8172342.1 hypothetical protein [Acetobacter tropicalis]
MSGVRINERDLAAEIGKIIRRERLKRQWTVERLVVESERDRNTIMRIESGAICSRLPVLMDLLWALDCEQDVFLEIVAADAALRMPHVVAEAA